MTEDNNTSKSIVAMVEYRPPIKYYISKLFFKKKTKMSKVTTILLSHTTTGSLLDFGLLADQFKRRSHDIHHFAILSAII